MYNPNKFQFILDVDGIETDVLTNAPEDWLNTNITFKRSASYIGLFRGSTGGSKFVKRGAQILRNEFYTKGLLGNVKNKIKQLDPASGEYNDIYSGQVDFSKAVDELTAFTVNSISDDFSSKLNANESTDYSIPIDVNEAINLELTPITLKETADLIFETSPDFRSDAFFEIGIVNNTQMSVAPSVQVVGFLATITPTFDKTNNYFFFIARTGGNVNIQGVINSSVNSGHYQFNVYKSDGTLVKTLSDVTYSITTQNTFSFNFVVPVNTDDRLFFYIKNMSLIPNTFTGVNMQSGTMTLSYQTITPASMCQALPVSYLFGQLLQAMNTNLDSGPNQPVPFKSSLLTGPLSQLYITSSDSIRQATGSLFHAGDIMFQGAYKVLSGTITYSGINYVTDDTFSYNPSFLTFSGGGVIQKVQSFLIGQVYNPGDTLAPGGTFLIGGNAGTTIFYNATTYTVGTGPQFFTYVLGFETFTGSDPSSFVEQTSVAPQIVTNFRDFFKTIYGVQCGNAAFGIENGVCFIESLDYVYRATIGNLNAGIVDKNIKIQPATDIQGNTIIVGYKDQQYGPLNGYNEVNSNQTYTTSVLQPAKTLDFTCVYRADPEGIEEIRITQTDTAASRSDNDVFMVWVKSTPENTVPFTYYHPLRTEGIMTNISTGKPMITGVDPSYYNWMLSPKQNLLRGGQFLSSIFYNMAGFKITLSAALKNTAMVTTDLTGRRVSEADPVYISSLPAPVFIPVYVTIKPGLPVNALGMIDNVPYGFTRFTYNGNVYKGFAENISIDIGQNSTQELKLKLTPDNDLTTFIH